MKCVHSYHGYWPFLDDATVIHHESPQWTEGADNTINFSRMSGLRTKIRGWPSRSKLLGLEHKALGFHVRSHAWAASFPNRKDERQCALSSTTAFGERSVSSHSCTDVSWSLSCVWWMGSGSQTLAGSSLSQHHKIRLRPWIGWLVPFLSVVPGPFMTFDQ